MIAFEPYLRGWASFSSGASVQQWYSDSTCSCDTARCTFATACVNGQTDNGR